MDGGRYLVVVGESCHRHPTPVTPSRCRSPLAAAHPNYPSSHTTPQPSTTSPTSLRGPTNSAMSASFPSMLTHCLPLFPSPLGRGTVSYKGCGEVRSVIPTPLSFPMRLDANDRPPICSPALDYSIHRTPYPATLSRYIPPPHPPKHPAQTTPNQHIIPEQPKSLFEEWMGGCLVRGGRGLTKLSTTA